MVGEAPFICKCFESTIQQELKDLNDETNNE